MSIYFPLKTPHDGVISILFFVFISAPFFVISAILQKYHKMVWKYHSPKYKGTAFQVLTTPAFSKKKKKKKNYSYYISYKNVLSKMRITHHRVRHFLRNIKQAENQRPQILKP
jgi:hypothetical protein